MKKGSQIFVRGNAKYKGQDMSWTETFTGNKKIGKGGRVGNTYFTNRNKIIFTKKNMCSSK